MNRLLQCSERCGWCGRCDTRQRHVEGLTADDHAAISRAWRLAGIGQDYLGWEDRVYLHRQGHNVERIIEIGLEMADKDKRLQQRVS